MSMSVHYVHYVFAIFFQIKQSNKHTRVWQNIIFKMNNYSELITIID